MVAGCERRRLEQTLAAATAWGIPSFRCRAAPRGSAQRTPPSSRNPAGFAPCSSRNLAGLAHSSITKYQFKCGFCDCSPCLAAPLLLVLALSDMTLFLAGHTALEFWRHYASAPTMPTNRLPHDEAPPTWCEAQALAKALPLLKQPYNVAVSKHDDRRVSALVRCMVLSCPLPEGSFLQTGLGTYVASAPLAFLQMAPALPLPSLIELGYALCGHYTFTPDPSSMALEAPPLASAATLAHYVGQARKMHGAKKARRAARYVLDGSNSPAETLIAMLLALPLSLGGYALPAPTLNPRLTTGKHDAALVSQQCYRPDLFWPDQRIALEYDSLRHHAGFEKVSHDFQRGNEMRSMGLTVMTISWPQIAQLANTDRLAHQLRELLKLRKRPHPEGFRQRQASLRNCLIPRKRDVLWR